MRSDLHRIVRATLLSLLVSGCMDPIPENMLVTTSARRASVSGKVLDPEGCSWSKDSCNAKPVSDALVAGYSATGERWYRVTDPDGTYRGDDLPLGSVWSLLVRKEGYLPGWDSLVVGEYRQDRDLYIGRYAQSLINKIDVLLVIDNSAGMANHQARLAMALPKLIYGMLDGLKRITFQESIKPEPEDRRILRPLDITLDLQIGATTGDLPSKACPAGSSGGKLLFGTTPECRLLADDSVASSSFVRTVTLHLPWRRLVRDESKGFEFSVELYNHSISDKTGEISDPKEVSKVWTTAGDCLVKQGGESGCNYQQLVTAAERALEEGATAFRRQNAALVIIIVTNHDDCSPDWLDGPEPASDILSAGMRCFERGVSCRPTGSGMGPRWNCRLDGWLRDIESAAKVLRLKPAPVFLGVVAGDQGPVEIVANQDSPRLHLASVCGHSPAYVGPSFHLRGLVDKLRPFARLASLCGNLDDALYQLGVQAAQATLLWK